MFLLDCGEGTQRQMMRYGVGFSLDDILISHLHSDHYLGLPGLLRTMSLQGRTAAMRLWGPRGGADTLRELRDIGGERLSFETTILELGPGDSVPGDGFRIETVATEHTRDSLGFVLAEDPRPGRFDVAAAERMAVPAGPLFGRLHRGEDVALPDGSVVRPSDVVGPERPGRKVVYSADTRPCRTIVEAAREADLLVHEATFDTSERLRAGETGHSTAAQAAAVAKEAGVRRLVLTHISARYAENPGALLAEARAVFPETELAKDGWTTEVAFPDDPGAGP